MFSDLFCQSKPRLPYSLGLLVSPDGLFRHAAAFAIEKGQYSEPLLFKKKGVILHNLGCTLGVQAG